MLWTDERNLILGKKNAKEKTYVLVAEYQMRNLAHQFTCHVKHLKREELTARYEPCSVNNVVSGTKRVPDLFPLFGP